MTHQPTPALPAIRAPQAALPGALSSCYLPLASEQERAFVIVFAGSSVHPTR